MKRTFCFLFIALLVFSTGCNKDKSVNAGEETLKRLSVNVPYSIRSSLSVAIRPELIERKYGKPDITKTIGKKEYEIRNISDGSRLITVYTDNRVIDMWQLKKLYTQKDFKSIISGKSTLEDVLKIDPYSTIIGTDKNGTTEHKLKDNKNAIIAYSKRGTSLEGNNSWIVSSIKFNEKDSSELFGDTESRKLIK